MRDLATSIRATLRAGDVLVRWDERTFACALPGLQLPACVPRVRLPRTVLGARRPAVAASVGSAQLRDDESPEALAARAELPRRSAMRRSDG